MMQAFIQVHFIKFAPLKAAKPRLDFILLPTAEGGSWQDLPGTLFSHSRTRESEGSTLRDQSYTDRKPLGTAGTSGPAGCPLGQRLGRPGPAALALPAQRAQCSPGPTARAKGLRERGLLLVGGRHRDPLKCCPLHPHSHSLFLCSLDYFHSGQPRLFSLQ